MPFPSVESLARVSFDGYANIWHDSSVVRAIWNTAQLALVTSVATIVLALLVSWFVVRRAARWQRRGHII